MEALAKRLAAVVARPLRAPIDAECIVVQGLGMERWLSMRLARELGVWANPDFPFPRNLITRAIAKVLGEVDPAASFEPQTLLWSIADLLPVLRSQPEFAPIDAYLKSDEQALRRIALAERIAATFDQYAVYRPQMVLGWGAGRGQDWQAVLWRALVHRHGSTHMAARIRDLLAALRGRRQPIAGFPPRVSLFGVSTLPPLYVDALVALAELVEIHFFLLSPSREYWAEIRSKREIIREIAGREEEEDLHLEVGNPLLASLGRLGRDFQRVLERAGDYQEDPDDDYVDPGEGSMLHQLQSDILFLRHRREDNDEAPTRTLFAADGSIAVHACHGPMREVEVLHDQLVELFEKDSTLEPRDVVVMSPAIDAYAPFIDAVFDRARGEEAARPEIPYHIADRSPRATDEVVNAFAKLLEILRGRVTASEVLDLLAIDAIRARFGIEAEDLDSLRRWVAESGIRWGVDAQHRSSVGQPSLRENTWRFGLDRLLLGYALRGEGRELFGGILPCDDVEGGSAELLGRFADFCETLFAFRESFGRARALAEWQKDLGEFLDRMVAATPSNRRQHQRIRATLEVLAASAEAAGFREPLELEPVRLRIDLAFRENVSTGSFLSRGVTFCALVPMRSIPFRVVCLLGLSDGAFPRVRRPLGFDLMAERPRAGDRTQRDDDRYLFLESLLSARERLLITYVGHSIHDNSAMPPSVIVSELLDTLEESLRIDGKNARDEIVVHHPLQPFSPRYFGADPDPRFFSYARNYYSGAQTLAGRERQGRRPFLRGPLGEEVEPSPAVTLDELVRFFENPARAFLQRRLGLWLGDDLDVLEDREPIDPNSLEEWKVGSELLERALDGEDLASVFESVRASGRVPLGVPGRCFYENLRETVDRIAAEGRRWRDSVAPVRLAVERQIDGIELSGVIRNLSRAGQLHCQYGKITPKHELGGWIRHLGLCLADPGAFARETVLVGRSEEDKAAVVRFSPVESPEVILRELLRFYRLGQTSALPFFPRASRAYWSAVAKSGESAGDKAIGKARVEFEGGYRDHERVNPEGEDPYIDQLFGGTDPLADMRFGELAHAVFEPLLRHRREDS
jgi:exodeoxyribonuclease V gamma subunit